MDRARDLPVSLDALRGFEAAARLLSFTAAARELFVTQSAVSRQVQHLEEQLGVKLFHRRTRALQLTEPGALYFREVARALQQLREATATVRAPANPVITVTTTVTFASLWLVPRLTRFQASHSDIAIHVAAENAVRSLDRDGLDLAVRYSGHDLAGEGALRLFGERVAPVCSPEFAKKRGPIRSPEDLLRMPLLHFEDPDVATPWLSWEVWLEAMRVRNPKVPRGLRFSHYDQLVQAASAGQGIGLGRFPIVQRLLNEGGLVTPLRSNREANLAQNRAYWLIVAPHAQNRPEVKTFVRWLRREAQGT